MIFIRYHVYGMVEEVRETRMNMMMPHLFEEADDETCFCCDKSLNLFTLASR